MKIGIIGGSGFIGSHLTYAFIERGHEVVIFSRSPEKVETAAGIEAHPWPVDEERWVEEGQHIDVVVNLAGETINQRWTKKAKQRILESRVETTQRIREYISTGLFAPQILVSASAIGYYGTSSSQKFTEEDGAGDDFLAHVCQRWEQEAEQVTAYGVRVVQMRLGLVLDKYEGALTRIVLPYKLWIGGRLGQGQQWASWIHITDLVRLFNFVLQQPQIEGPVNATAPEPVTMEQLGRTIGKTLQRPHWLPVPGFPVKIVLGEMSNLILKGQYVRPIKALEHGFEFRYDTIGDALEHLLK